MWARPWLWPALWRRRKALRLSQEYREAAARIQRFGCRCGRAVRGSPAARRRRAFHTCPDFGCTREVADHVRASSPPRRITWLSQRDMELALARPTDEAPPSCGERRDADKAAVCVLARGHVGTCYFVGEKYAEAEYYQRTKAASHTAKHTARGIAKLARKRTRL